MDLALPAMVDARHGCVINVASMAGRYRFAAAAITAAPRQVSAWHRKLPGWT